MSIKLTIFNFEFFIYKIFKPVYDNFNSEVIEIESTELLGKTKYDFIGLIYQIFWNKLHIWIGTKDPEKAMKRMYCYESIAYLHRRSDTFKNWWKVTPKSLFNSIEFEPIQEGL